LHPFQDFVDGGYFIVDRNNNRQLHDNSISAEE
jgi:hypothetical protein